MNENRLSFEPDNLQNNRATVLEQIYTLITSCRLLLASAIFPPFPCSMQHTIPTMLCIFIPRGLPTYTARTYDDYSVCSLARLRSLYSSRSPSMAFQLTIALYSYLYVMSQQGFYLSLELRLQYPIAEETVQKLLQARSSQANAVKVVLATLSNGKLHLQKRTYILATAASFTANPIMPFEADQTLSGILLCFQNVHCPTNDTIPPFALYSRTCINASTTSSSESDITVQFKRKEIMGTSWF